MTLYPEPLTLDHAAYLAPRIREADRKDLKLYDRGPEYALAMALVEPGEAWAVMDGGTPIGAGGWTEAGVVWTLWVDLTLSQAKEMLRMCVPWARILAIRAGRRLENMFRITNPATYHFLKATRCVEFTHSGTLWQAFRLLPLEELPHV
jgi:hypothetical protein